jgi:hypothetical protein
VGRRAVPGRLSAATGWIRIGRTAIMRASGSTLFRLRGSMGPTRGPRRPGHSTSMIQLVVIAPATPAAGIWPIVITTGCLRQLPGLGFRAGGNCSAYQARLYSPSGVMIASSNIARRTHTGTVRSYRTIYATSGAFRVEISYEGASGTAPADGTCQRLYPRRRRGRHRYLRSLHSRILPARR